MTESPRVTAVVPSRNRPGDVVKAARSALAQTVRDLEVVVVLDGADPVSRQALEELADGRLRVVEHPASRGANAARNTGIAAARAPWVAFLDDDDEWLPEKLERQLERAAREAEPPIVACRMELRQSHGSYVVPRRAREPGEPLSEYLFCRRGWFKREGAFQTSMILARTDLLRRVPFREEIAQSQETDWLFRATADSGDSLVYCDEVLGVWNDARDRPRLTDEIEWRGEIAWIRSVRGLVTPRAYAAYVLIWATDAAANAGRKSAYLSLLREAFRGGAPRAKDLLVFLWLTLLPPRLRRELSPHRRVEGPLRAAPG